MCHFETEFGFIDEEFPFCDALWTCSTMFSNWYFLIVFSDISTTKVGHKRIFLFTNEDNPNGDNPPLRSRSIQRAHDLKDLGIAIELFSMNKPGQIFDLTKFYSQVLDEDEDGIGYDANAKFEELKSRVRRKEFKKRTLASIRMKIADVEIAIKV